LLFLSKLFLLKRALLNATNFFAWNQETLITSTISTVFYVQAIAISPIAPSLVYLGGSKGLYLYNETSGNITALTTDGSIYTLTFSLTNSSILYVGGNLTTFGGVNVNNFAAYNTQTRTVVNLGFPLPSDPNSYVSAITICSFNASLLYVGGLFGGPYNSTLMYDEQTQSYSPMGSGFTGFVNVITCRLLSGTVYFGGRFDHADGVPARNVVVWQPDRALFFPIGSVGTGGFDEVNAIAISVASYSSGNPFYVYVGGYFISVQGVTGALIAVSNMAYYDEEQDIWNELEGGCDNSVNGIAMSGSYYIYVSGLFSSCGSGSNSISSNNLALFDAAHMPKVNGEVRLTVQASSWLMILIVMICWINFFTTTY